MPVEVVIPNLGITVENGKIIEWSKNEGDSVEKGETLFVVEADKVTTEVESPAAGVLAKILVETDLEVPVFTVVALIAQEGEKIPDDYQPSAPPPAAGATEEPTQPKTEAKPEAKTAAPAVSETVSEGLAMPAARKLAGDHGLDLTTIVGTGPDGVIQLKDVRAALEAPAGAAVKASTLARREADKKGISLEGIEGTGVRGRIMRSDLKPTALESVSPGLDRTIPMDSMRKAIAKRMSESAFTAPHIYFYSDILMDPLLNFRKGVLGQFEEKFGLRPSVNDFLIKAVALTILEYPVFNGVLNGDEIYIKPHVNVCLAVALPKGLIVPALDRTCRAGLVDIIEQRTDLVNRAREGKLTREEMERGTFTVSSLAQYDITFFTSILNPPQCGILSVGKTRDELYLDDGEVKSRKTASFGLAVDHRVIDGATAAMFLQSLKSKLENPNFTFLHL